MAVRDRRIGWSVSAGYTPPPESGRQNVRFVILPAGARRENVGSRVLGLSLRRLSGKILVEHGYPVLLAGTFVDRAIHRDTCYRTANWQPLELTRGFTRWRCPTALWRHDGQPKQVLVYRLGSNVQAHVSQSEEEVHWRGSPKNPPAPAAVLRSVLESLHQEPPDRPAGGIRANL